MSACLVFVFAGLLEYALVNVIARKGELRQQVRFSKEVSYLLLYLLLFCWTYICDWYVIRKYIIEKKFGQTIKSNFNSKTT
jgi:hypothetical protein